MRHLLTSALPYANGPLHLGHLAGAYLPADLYARYLRAAGKEVLWVCGSDEHGAAITLRAKQEGISPRDIIDKYHALNKQSFADLGISFDYYHRTSAPLHHETSQDFFRVLDAKDDGDFITRTTEQYYDAEFGQFLADRYIRGTCPHCGYPAAHGDQCENCGSDLSPTELIDPVSTLSGKKPELRETTHWYFDLSKYEDFLREWIAEGTIGGEPHHDPTRWKKHVLGQCLSWLDQGLLARAITRDLDWGISVPREDAEGKVLYVWFDAPIGYISSTRQWCEENGQQWRRWWQNGETELVHFIGKDNIVFHCLIFPAMLRAHGDFILPRNVPANQFLNFEGEKFSKSRGWGIELHEYVEEFKDFPFGVDALRWALIRNMPEQSDADFTWDGFTEYYDKDLADKLGNFFNRVTVLMHKYFGGKLPAPAEDSEVRSSIHLHMEAMNSAFQTFRFKDAAAAFVELAQFGNTYLQDAAPWTLAKEDPDDPRIARIMFDAAQVAAALALTAHPFVPAISGRLRKVLGQGAVGAGDWDVAYPYLSVGQSVEKAGVLFPKINDRKDDRLKKIVERQRGKLDAGRGDMGHGTIPTSPIPKSSITFEDFTKLDLRTATVLSAERIKKSNKLLHLTIDMGELGQRSVVSGIAKQFAPEEVAGKRVVVVANLPPRKMAGVLSEAMILMAEDEQGTLGFVEAPAGVGAGAVVR